MTTSASYITVSILLFGLGALVSRLLRHRPAATRHLVWLVVLAGSVESLVLSPLVRPLNVRIPLPWDRESRPGRTSAPIANALAPEDPPLSLESLPPEAAEAPAPPATGNLPTVLLLIWAAGAAAVACYRVAGEIRVHRLARRAVPPDPSWNKLLASLSAWRGPARAIDLRVSAEISGPAVAGLLRSVILLPTGSDTWSEEDRRAVLLHETAHVARRDAVSRLIANVATVLQWFHPGAWYAARRLRDEIERSCDDYALTAGVDPAQYAASLVMVARAALRPRRAMGAVMEMTTRHQIEDRVQAILNPALPRSSPRVAVATTLAALWFAALAPLSAVRPVEARDSVLTRTAPGRDGETLTMRLDTRSPVDIRGWDQPRVELEARLHGDAVPAALAFARGDSGVLVGLATPDHRPTSSQRYALALRIPRSMRVALESRNGAVHLGQLDAGANRVRVGNGDIAIEAAPYGGDFRTERGNVKVGEAGGTMRAQTSRGDIRVAVALAAASGGEVFLRSDHGDVVLEIPPGLAATLDLEAAVKPGRGGEPIDSDWPLTMATGPGNDPTVHNAEFHRARGTIGGGGIHLVVRVTNGHIVVRRTAP